MTKQEAIDYINAHTWSQRRVGLGRMTELLHRLGDPQKKLRFVHVAGSNGKGSTCAMVEHVLREAGYRTGLFPSPFIEDFRERIQVSGEYISEQGLGEITELVRKEADEMEDHPGHFELITAIGMLYFAREKCDLVVLEVGMGGEFDATNVIDAPEVCVITHIGLEHTEYLGDTLAKIARTKAGIIKTGADVVLYENDPEVMTVVEEVCREKGCRLHVVQNARIVPKQISLDGQSFVLNKNTDPAAETGAELSAEFPDGLELRLPLLGRYQLDNAAVVVTVLEVMRARGYSISEEALRKGLAEVKWPARFEVLCREPLFILDGGHNPQCAQAMAESLETYLPAAGAQKIVPQSADSLKTDPPPLEEQRNVLGGSRKVVFLMGVLADKDYKQVVGLISPYAAEFVCVAPKSDRALPASELAVFLREKGFRATACDSIEEGITLAIKRAGGKLPVVAFGSLYVAGEIRTTFPGVCKKQQRVIATARRRALTAEERAAKSLLITEHLSKWLVREESRRREEGLAPIHTILSYRAVWDEADLDTFNGWAQAQGYTIAFPISQKGGVMLAAVPEDETAWVTGKYGILEPDRERSHILSPEEIDLILIPCVAFDRRGHRCGHGAGYYDRFLPACRSDAAQILAAFDAQQLQSVAVEKTDVPMKCIVTESGVFVPEPEWM